MKAETFELLKDIFFILFLLGGTLWLWGRMKFGEETQQKWEKVFARSRTRFKWLFLIGLILVTGMFVWKQLII